MRNFNDIEVGRLSEKEKRELLKDLLLRAGSAESRTEKKRALDQGPPLMRANRDCPLPLSFMQERLWFFDQLNPRSPAYNLAFVAKMDGPTNMEALERSFGALLKRHETLRTRFASNDGQPIQLIAEESNFQLRLEDLSGVPQWDREREVQMRIQREAQQPFDLEAGPLFRVRMLRVAAQEHLLLFSMHHIISDGWSIGVLIQELTALYESFDQRRSSKLAELTIQYADFALWQRGWLAGNLLEEHLRYWRDVLADAPAALEVLTDHERPAIARHRGAIVSFRWDKALQKKLKALSNAEGVTLFMTLLASWALLLSRYSGQDDVVIGSPIASRNRPELEGLIGFFANSLALRVRLEGDPTLHELLDRVKQSCLGAYSHQDMPFEKLVEELSLNRSLNRAPLFQVMFVFQNAGQAAVQSTLLKLQGLPTHTGTSKFDLTLVMHETSEGLRGELEYDSDLFRPETVLKMLDRLKILVNEVADNSTKAISELTWISGAEQQELLVGWNQSQALFAEDAPAHRLFEAQVERTPESVALIQGDDRLNYGELNRRANQLAHILRAMGAGPEVAVGLCAERSIEMIVGLMGILKAGGAYVPIEPAHPAYRRAAIAMDAGIKIVLTEPRLETQWPQDVQVVFLDDRAAEEKPSIAEENLAGGAGPGNVAYVIYTSGSSGTPKGVTIPHAGLTNTLLWRRSQFRISTSDRILQNIAISFDPSLWQILGALISGAALVLVRHDAHQDLPYVLEQIAAHQVTITDFPPSLLQELLEFESVSRCSSLRLVFVGGEALSASLKEKFMSRLPSELCNVYGPTETSIDATWWRCLKDESQRRIPIGRPIANKQMYVLDSCLRPVPCGVAGEIFIAGAGLARGYLNHPGLTAEKFVPNPFSAQPGSRLYRTGDRGYYRNDGSLHFLGRVDRQVKIRGLRIELGEIENVLVQHPAVSDCAISIWERNSEKRLVAYVASRRDKEKPDAAELRNYLRSKLPSYMIPAACVVLDSLPRTAAGKLDQKALPALEELAGPRTDSLSPRNELERTIAKLWQDALGLPKVGVNGNFFDLGGHSLLLTRIHRQLSGILERELPVVALFQYPTIAGLAQYLGNPQVGGVLGDVHGSAQKQIATLEQQAKLAPDATQAKTGSIAVIGMAGRFPSAPNLEQFWKNLRDGVEAVTFFTQEELEAAGVPATLLQDSRYIRSRAVLEDVEYFDAAFFGFTPREAELLDPQQRIFLQCAWHAMENAGYDPARCRASVGVYGGLSSSTYRSNNLRHLVEDDARTQAELGNDRDFFGTRVSYKLNLKGPSLTIQTACSTSLVAIHTACQALLTYQCDMALAGGATLRLPQISGYTYNEGGIASRDGHCRAFDENASGTIAGSGAGVVVLKRLSDALADGDRIDAVILGSAINNDGSNKVGYTAPSVEGQAEVIRTAQTLAGVNAGSITYIETHGTGTRLGDPIEVAALSKAFRTSTEERGFCAIGSVKTNIGHLDAAAGVAGFIKTVLALRHGKIPPSLHFQRPNPNIDFANSPFYVNTTLTDWVASGARRAGASSFGIGGTNAHVVLQEAPKPLASTPSRPWELLTLSAHSADALDESIRKLACFLKLQPEANLADVAYTCRVGRHAFEHRAALVCASPADAAAVLEDREADCLLGEECATEQRPVVFLFPGQGSQYPDMGLELYDLEPTFRREIDDCCELLKPHLGFDLRKVLYPRGRDVESATRRLRQTSVTQPALFIVEYALARLWIEWGVRPTAMAGHSIGEYVAACLAGVMSKEEALEMVALRGSLMEGQPRGAMLAVPLSVAEIEPLLVPQISVAAVNGPRQVVISGREDHIAVFEQSLAENGVASSRLRTSHAFHSAMMDPILATFRQHAATLRLRAPQIPFISNLSGRWITDEEATSPDYWARHLRGTVLFADTISELLREPSRVLLEVGPGRTLQTLVRSQCDPSRIVLGSLRHPHDSSSDLKFLLTTAGRLWVSGVDIDASGIYQGQRRQRVELPVYPFERQRFWVEPEARKPTDISKTKRRELEDWFYVPVWKQSPQMPHHAIQHETSCCLLFADSLGLGSALAQKLEAAGRKIICVSQGSQFELLGGMGAIHPAHAQDYIALFDALRSQGEFPSQIVHLWSVDQYSTAKFPDPLQSGFDSLLYLAQALGCVEHDSTVDLVVVSHAAHEVTGAETLEPIRATVMGPCLVIPQELARVTCRNIDIVDPQVPSTADMLQRLLDVPAETGPVVAIRNGYCWAPAFEPIPVKKSSDSRLRHQGVYVIIGGLGGIGLEIAADLARRANARLALITRGGLPPRERWDATVADAESKPGQKLATQIQRVRALEEQGSEVMVLAADCTDPAQMFKAFDAVRQHFGAIHGVLHAAGVAGGELIELTTPTSARKVMSPKIEGPRVLYAMPGISELDFIVLFSSLSAVVGGIGRVDYCAANAFLDSFALSQRKNGPLTISINWDAWQDVGMGAENPLALQKTMLPGAISPQEGVEAFHRALSMGLPRVAVSVRDLKEHSRSLSTSKQSIPGRTAPKERQNRPHGTVAYVAPRNNTEESLAVIWQELLGITPIGIHDDFHVLGGDSLLASQVVSRIRHTLDVDLPLRTFFEGSTIASVALAIVNLRAQHANEKSLEDMLSQLEQLSDEDAEQEFSVLKKGVTHA